MMMTGIDTTSAFRKDLFPATLEKRRSLLQDGMMLGAALMLASFGVIFQAITCCDCALAATWPAESPRLSTSMGFHETYSAGDQCYVHSGIDISASAGTQIFAPLAGRVSFAGSIPSGDSLVTGGGEGQTMRAVSVALEDGRTVTLMPFAQMDVSVGDAVAEGAALGTLAASGDRSTFATHLHMGLKDGDTYLDPLMLFGATSEAPNQEAQAGVAAAMSAESIATDPEVASENAVATPDFSAAEEATSIESVVPQQEQEASFGTITSGNSELAAVSVRENLKAADESPLAPVANWASGLLEACVAQAVDLRAGLQSMASFIGVPFAVVAVSATVLSIAAVVALGLVILHQALPFAASILQKRKSALVRKQFG